MYIYIYNINVYFANKIQRNINILTEFKNNFKAPNLFMAFVV